VLADYTWKTAPVMNVLIYPGGRGTREHVGDAAIHAWLTERASEADIVSSVCTGALVLADAGLLDGRPATTHWESLDTLAELGTNIEVRPGDRFVDSGDIITAAGVSAGIDMALHLIVRIAGEDRAREVRRYIQYDPEPPV
jgi:transcriptional regulator GlxA family with amidase domain